MGRMAKRFRPSLTKGTNMIGSFNFAFAKVIDVEKGLNLDPQDDGNWTGGKNGVGELRGTKYGISAKAYPHLDIAKLTLDQAKETYRVDYWNLVHGDKLPDPLSHFVFDAAVNQGVSAAIFMLQTALKVKVDGKIGPKTIAAAQSSDNETCANFMMLRAFRYMSTINFGRYGPGWFNRLFLFAMGSR